MAKNYHYYGISNDRAWHMVNEMMPTGLKWFKPILFDQSDVVWCQGPRGGVRVIHTRDWLDQRQHGYIRKSDEEAMKEFAWVKLRAVDLG